MYSRRNFIKTSAIAGAATLAGSTTQFLQSCKGDSGRITIKKAESRFEREPPYKTVRIQGYISK